MPNPAFGGDFEAAPRVEPGDRKNNGTVMVEQHRAATRSFNSPAPPSEPVSALGRGLKGRSGR